VSAAVETTSRRMVRPEVDELARPRGLLTPKLARRQSQMPRCERSSTCEHRGQGISCDVPSSRAIAPLHFGHRRESCRPALSSGLAARSTTAISLQAGQTPSPPQNASRPARPHPTESFPVANPQAGHVSSTSDPMTQVPYPALSPITTSCGPAKTMTAPSCAASQPCSDKG
jgi:hypothetical protein